MEKLDSVDAVKIISAGITSGSITLRGTTGSSDTDAATKRAEIDSIYLLTLLKRLQGL